MELPPMPPGLRGAQAAERGFVRMFGGYTVGLAGGTLLVNEKIPVPRFNLVQLVRVGPGRVTAFFEAALDHYFQRALRPSFRVAVPVPPHVDRALTELAFRADGTEEVWLIAGTARPRAAPAEPGLVPVPPEEIEELLDLWTTPKEREEFRRQLEVGRNHPNPNERVEPYALAAADGALRCGGLAYRRDRTTLLEGIATPVGRRGEGAATAWVEDVLATPIGREPDFVTLRTQVPRLAQRLARFGFREALRSRIYELPKDAQLAKAPPAPPGPPRWRPPRIA